MSTARSVRKITTGVALGLLTLVPHAAWSTEFHVAVTGSDAGDGSSVKPFKTISKGALLAQPGDVVTVHAGVYRERVNPPRGGESDAQRIVYQAAPGEKVEIKGSEVLKGWTRVTNDVWTVTVPNCFFGPFNPFGDRIRGDWFNALKGREDHTGAVYLNGEWLTEAMKLEDVISPGGSVLQGAPGECLLNVAWLQPKRGVQEAAKISATRYVAQSGVMNAPCSEGGECLGWLEVGDWVRYEAVNFGDRAERVEIRAASDAAGGQIELRLDTPNGELIGVCPVPNTGGWQVWTSFVAKIKPVSGLKTLCLVFKKIPVAGALSELWFAQVDKTNTTIWAQFNGVSPNDQLVEINTRQTVFYPDKPGRNYITVRGFTMRHAATPWAPPTAEQIGLIGTHWSKGWIIENNVISHSVCSGIALGKHGDGFDNTSADSAEGYVKTIERAHAFSIPWTKQNVGHHIVRNNTISHCEQAGIVGSMGCSFSTVTGNTIHDVHVRRLFNGAEMAGLKFHGAIDVEISRNQIYRCGTFGVWLDWMAQGTRVTGNLFYDNRAEDLFVEVNHGPFLVDNNLFLSSRNVLDLSEGGAYAHNLLTGKIDNWHDLGRLTPHLQAHSTSVAGLAITQGGDNRFFNNIFVGQGLSGDAPVPASDPKKSITGFGLWVYDARNFSLLTGGNVYYNGARPYAKETAPLTLAESLPKVELTKKEGGLYLQMTLGEGLRKASTELVTTESLGKARVSGLAFEAPDGKPLRLDTDYFGKKRDLAAPSAGPFENPGKLALSLKVR